jgi:NAD+ kinase
MKLNRVLLIYKPHDADASSPAKAARRGTSLAIRAAARDETLAALTQVLARLGIPFRLAARDRIPARHGADLLVPLGGDGTFLAAAHAAGDVPLLGVNSNPERSVGFFCAATTATFDRLVQRIARGHWRPCRLPLIETRIGGKALPIAALNDILFAGASPAETVRYELRVGPRSAEQRSSGIWISAGPGSSAAIRSAGGTPLDTRSERLQFLVREPCPIPGHHNRLLRGVLARGTTLTIRSRMHSGMIYIDGHWHAYPVPQGTVVECKVSKRRLNVFL